MGEREDFSVEEGRRPLVNAGRWATLGEILPGFVHELNNALNAILGFAEIWKDARSLPMEAREDLNAIWRSAIRARNLIQDVLTIARGMAVEVQREPVSLPDLCDRAMTLMAAPLRWARAKLIRDYHPQTPVILSDARRLLLILLALLQNCCDSLQRTGKGGQITLRTYPTPDGWVAIEVNDDGPGIVASVWDRLFEPFVTTKPEKGTGLGLFFVRQIVEEIGGSVEVKRERETRVLIRLPVGTG